MNLFNVGIHIFCAVQNKSRKRVARVVRAKPEHASA